MLELEINLKNPGASLSGNESALVFLYPQRNGHRALGSLRRERRCPSRYVRTCFRVVLSSVLLSSEVTTLVNHLNGSDHRLRSCSCHLRRIDLYYFHAEFCV